LLPEWNHALRSAKDLSQLGKWALEILKCLEKAIKLEVGFIRFLGKCKRLFIVASEA